MHKALQALRDVGGTTKKLRTADFDLKNAAGDGSDEVIAEYNPPAPIALRPDARHRMVLVAAEEFTTNGTAGDTETFALAHDAIDSENVAALELYENGARVKPDSVDYGANTFDYTDDGTGNYLHVYYVPRGGNRVTLRKTGPGGNLNEELIEDTSISLAERNQNKEPVEFDARGAAQGVVPQNWKLQLVSNGTVGFEWDDSDKTNSQGTEASIGILNVRIVQFKQSPDGLERAVKGALIGRR